MSITRSLFLLNVNNFPPTSTWPAPPSPPTYSYSTLFINVSTSPIGSWSATFCPSEVPLASLARSERSCPTRLAVRSSESAGIVRDSAPTLPMVPARSAAKASAAEGPVRPVRVAGPRPRADSFGEDVVCSAERGCCPRAVGRKEVLGPAELLSGPAALAGLVWMHWSGGVAGSWSARTSWSAW